MVNQNIGTFFQNSLPFKAIGKVEKGKTWVDPYPSIPFTMKINGTWVALSSDEREYLHNKEKAKAERAAKKAAKIAAGWVPKVKEAKEGKVSIPRTYPQKIELSPQEKKRIFAEENARLVELNSQRLLAIQSAKDTTIRTVKMGGTWIQKTQEDIDGIIACSKK